jgi:phage terminase large subunit
VAPIGVHFGSNAHDSSHFENKRAEMYFDAVDWIRAGGALPRDEEFLQDLVNTTYMIHPKTNLMILEPKAMVKSKQSGRSPDKADAFVLTFAEPVTIKQGLFGRGKHVSGWEPFPVDNAAKAGYDPYGGPP